MNERLRTLGVVLAVLGLAFVAGGGFGFYRVQQGYGSLQAFSEAQSVELSYNEDGQLIDRGTTEGADAIMVLLEDDWAFPVVDRELDPADPLVNTGTEYMFQMATIAYHTLNGSQTVVLTEDVEYNGETFTAGSYDVPVDGKYWTDFDRQHPLEGPARAQAWSGTAHGLIGELGVGTVTASALQLGLGLSAAIAGIGLTLLVAGFGMVWVAKAESVPSVIIKEQEMAAK